MPAPFFQFFKMPAMLSRTFPIKQAAKIAAPVGLIGQKTGH
jgi:hypothetical protein